MSGEGPGRIERRLRDSFDVSILHTLLEYRLVMLTGLFE